MHYTRLIHHIICLFLLQQYSILALDCPLLNVGTEPNQDSGSDIIHEGKTSKFWVFGSSTPIITVQSKALQYFYVQNTKVNLTKDLINLKYDNDLFANTTYDVRQEGKGYVIEISYGCNDVGGALITYTLTIAAPDCGTGAFSWKKVCGYPLSPKDGLMVEMLYNNKSKVVVRDGLRVNNTIWDKEINNFALGLGLFDKVTFRVSMNHDESTHVLKNDLNPPALGPGGTSNPNNNNPGQNNSANNTPPSLAFDVYNLFPTTRISIPEVDSDEDMVLVTIGGPGKDGGIVSNETSLDIDLMFECKSDGVSTIELIIPLDYFRDVVLFFLKTCESPKSALAIMASNWIFWVIVIGVGFCIFKIYRNITVEGKEGLDALPFYENVKEISTKLQGGKWEILQDGNNSSIPKRSQYDESNGGRNKQNENESKATNEFDGDDDESEFKINNISEVKSIKSGKPTYGSLT